MTRVIVTERIGHRIDYPHEMYLKPSFFIIGERKCGTSSLFRYLVAHPHVLPGRLKEIQFFSRHSPEYISKHIDAYFAHFPPVNYEGDLVFEWPELNDEGLLYHEKVRVPRRADRVYITGEASANTFSEVAPELLHRYLPEVKLILLLRDPVERAYSHHRMYQRFQAEGRDLGMEVGDFESDMQAELKAHAQGKVTHYLSPGLYLDRLRQWEAVYGKESIRVYLTEDLNEAIGCRRIMADIQTYLGLPTHAYGDFLEKKFNQAPPAHIPKKLRGELSAFYQPHTLALAEHLGRKLPWG